MKNIFIIADDSTNNYLCELIIKSISPKATITSYTCPVHALENITASSIETHTTILLDLNMPEMSGWQFMEQFEMKQKKCSIYILTASVNPMGKENTFKYPMFKGFLTKPLSIENMKYIFELKNKQELLCE